MHEPLSSANSATPVAINPDFLRVVPEEKGLSPAWIASLTARGEVETFSGADLNRIGMPVGGLFCGTLYLGGDGRLWLWDIFNRGQEGIVPNTVFVGLQEVKSRDGSAFLAPPLAASHRLVEQGFTLKVKNSRGTIERSLDARGFSSVSFTGQYPVATIHYADAEVPVEIKLEAFSPFIPLNSADSSLPATIFSFQLHNTSDENVEIELSGRLENAVLRDHLDALFERHQEITFGDGFTMWHGQTRALESAEVEDLPDFGSMVLLLLGEPAQVQNPAVIGRLGRNLTLAPGEIAQVDFVIAWHFPNANDILGGQKRHYAARFQDAGAVARYITENFENLASQTRLWRDTWNDSTLPHWFLNRTFANTSTLATTTCHRFADGRFWAWEGAGCCPGTCTHVWHYAQAMARLFPEVERDHRQRVDFGLALEPETGVIRFRAEDGAIYAVDGQAGRILGAYREHQMSADDAFLQRLWPQIKRALNCLIATDGNGDGILYGPLHNTLDADWFGVVPWICGLYHAALRAGEAMAREMGDGEFQGVCHAILEGAPNRLDEMCWSETHGYYVHRGDPEHPGEVGAYGGCHIDQVLGQAWAHQVGLGQVMTTKNVRQALQSVWRYNFVPDVGPFREQKTAGRWYASAGDAGLIMVSYPFEAQRRAEGKEAWSAMYFNECMSGFEHQVAAHMIWEGMITEGLAVTRAIHDRYHPRLRNPYNEIECSDHYARAMSSYGTFLAVCGFEYHGPRGYLAFAPRLSPENFRAPFTCGEGWGTFEQQFQGGNYSASLAMKSGRLSLSTLALQLPDFAAWNGLTATLDGEPIALTSSTAEGRLSVKFTQGIELKTGQKLVVGLTATTS
ncbi:hypothetical protein B1R32_12712 [Abditibacterium utsteinense]|uniref:Beta-Glucocerebrosidase 2 N terminal n=1 Tax=Abditibacterium utsteinense TaxID=1960156 RepID=A0A2S8SP79_9BACT|nr:GH116 family glycosyl-hydrolase [Abditibacterium utsteinense]PQV62600.1 hypothetical protein B1R32_12712 [Abditibacterium utsteinense]